MTDPTAVHGLLLAAGEGRRMGMPKALVRDDDGTSWLLRSLAALRDGGCAEVTVVLGAGADEARLLLAGDVHVVVADDWAEGMGASLRAGLGALPDGVTGATAALVSLVDLPDVGPDVVRSGARRRDRAAGARPGGVRRRARPPRPPRPRSLGCRRGRPRAATVAPATTSPAHDLTLVECGDLASGADRDAR